MLRLNGCVRFVSGISDAELVRLYAESEAAVVPSLYDGFSLPAVEAMAGAGADLLIAVDCGIGAVEAVARARALGLDVVILDHHTPPEVRPDAMIVAPAQMIPQIVNARRGPNLSATQPPLI